MLVHAGFVFHFILFQNSEGYYTFNVNGNTKKELILICSTYWILCCREKTVVRLISWFKGIRYALYLKPNLEIYTSSNICIR